MKMVPGYQIYIHLQIIALCFFKVTLKTNN